MIYVFILARIMEACRDAIAFTKGNENLGMLWHGLKYFQFGALILTGYLFCIQANKVKDSRKIRLLIISVIALLFGFIAFEAFLKVFRRIDWTLYNWA